MDGTPKSLGQRVRQTRQAAKLTQVQLAARAKIGQSALSSIENDRTADIEAGTLLHLATALQVDPYWLLWGVAPPAASDAQIARVLAALTPANRHVLLVSARALLADQATTPPTAANPFPKAPAPPLK